MERVKTLTGKLQDQLLQNANVDQMLATVDMLRSELEHLKLIQPAAAPAPVTIAIAGNVVEKPTVRPGENNTSPEEKIVEMLQVDEAEVEAELEEIKRIAKEKSSMGAQHKPTVVFDPVEDIPTLTHQPVPTIPEPKAEINHVLNEQKNTSLNEKLKENKNELFDSLAETPVRDLRKAIGINDKFLFINDLFRGDETMYERSIKTINAFSIYPEAEYWIKRELKLKLGWDDRNATVKQFDQLVKRRFL